MTVLGDSNAVKYLTEKQVFPSNDGRETQASQRLVDALNSGDVMTALECLGDPFVDVNFVGTVSLRSKKTEIVLHGELAHHVRVEFDEFNTDVTPLFLAAHSGNFDLLRKLLILGANVNQKLFRGYATTAAVRENHVRILEVLISYGASQPACEEALMEASYLGRAIHAEMLMASDMIRSNVAVHALVTASSRGFVEVVDSLIKSGVDPNANDRLLLQSSKPSLYSSVNCNALVAAVIGRHINVVELLLKVGVRTDVKVNLGAWSWDADTEPGEEFRVGAGLADPYNVVWCAIEYFEASGGILTLLLQQVTPNIINVTHFGRTLIHHAILCNNAKAVDVLINCGADLEATSVSFSAIHLAARLGLDKILEKLIDFGGCCVDSLTGCGETAAMICARRKSEEGTRILALAGADFGLVSSCGESVASIVDSVKWSEGFRRAVLSVIGEGFCVRSSNKVVFSLLIFVTKANDIDRLKIVLERDKNTDVNEQDEGGFSATMVAARAGNVEAFKLLLYAGANLNLRNKFDETALTLCKTNRSRDTFEKSILKFALDTKCDVSNIKTFHALHCAARRGDLDYVRKFLTKNGYRDVNKIDDEGNTPLMVAAREGRAKVCEFLISVGAKCKAKNADGETALSLSRNKGVGNEAERVILDELARELVLGGANVAKHTRGGKGSPHKKVLGMVGSGAGVLTWGKSSKRNVVCKAAEAGPSDKFRRARRRKFDVDVPGLFHVVTNKDKEVHFVCEGGIEMANLWVRGIGLVTREAIMGKDYVI